MNYKNILTCLVLGSTMLLLFYLSGIIGILEFILSLSIYTLLFYLGHFLISKLRKKEIMYFPNFIKYFLQRISIFILFFTVLFTSITYLLNEVYPASMPEFTISNGTKEVKFQAMSHVGTRNFYDTVIQNLKTYKEDGGVYFFEGVRPGTKENGEKFNKALGIKFDKNLYKNFSKLYGVVNQDNREFLGLVNDLDFNTDIGIDQIVELYEERLSEKRITKEYENKLPIDANKVIIDTLSQLNPRQLKILIYINQAILNFILGSESTQSFLNNNFTNKDLFEVIVGERNKVIAKAISSSEYNNIYMTYGLLHFKGVLQLLKEKDSNWKITSIKKLYPIKN